jgi:hypothetical protein
MTGSVNSNARILAGECFCGAVRYPVVDSFEYALNCHCSNCRRTTGSAFKPFAGIARDRLSLTKGDDIVMIHGDEGGHDAHCRRMRLPALFGGARWRLCPCRDGYAG